MDIDDILAEFDATGELSTGERDVKQLTHWWVTERAAPEILQYQEETVERTMERVREQISVIEEQTGDLDPKANFQLVIIQTELERVKFLIRAYLRCRIQKIDKYALHILSNTNLRSRLSTSELSYLKTHQALLNNLYLSSFLKNFPESLRRLDDKAGGISMIEEPDMDSAVFLKVVNDVDIELAASGNADPEDEDALFDVVPMRAGELYIIRYSAVRDALGRGDVELI